MKATGIIRKLDELGRIVLPIELRHSLDINERDPLEIYVDGRNIILHKYEPTCIFCGSQKNLINFNGRTICRTCAEKINAAVNSQD